MGRVVKKMGRRPLLNYCSFIHKHYLIGHFTGKSHLMGYHNHGHAFPGKGNHNLKDLTNHFRIKC